LGDTSELLGDDVDRLKGRVAIITGAGRGIGREHALLFAIEGAHVVVNDLGSNPDGGERDHSPANQVVAEIRARGGVAIASHHDVADWDGAQQLVKSAVEHFGDLHVVVNNAGMLRDRMLVNMTEDEWDSVIRVHLKGLFCPTRWAAAHWREEAKNGRTVDRAVINTTSTSGLFGNVGQINYGTAKMGVGAFTIIAAQELERYGVRVNAIAPAARTRLTAGPASHESALRSNDPRAPSNIAPFVAYLATEGCPITGRVFFVRGSEVHLFQPWAIVDKVENDRRWTVEELERAAPRLGEVPFHLGSPLRSRDRREHAPPTAARSDGEKDGLRC
jgi:NAD(P)-dependent dehydrogenase (short-subunit alcohol dehydrogenase family)